MKMKLLRLVPLFVLLVTMVSLMPSAYADANCGYPRPPCPAIGSRSNNYRIIPPTTLAAGQLIGGTATIWWAIGEKPANPTPTVITFAFAPSAAGARQASAPVVGSARTDVVPDSAMVTIEGLIGNNGSVSSYKYEEHVNLPPAVAATATYEGPHGISVTVEITNLMAANNAS